MSSQKHHNSATSRLKQDYLRLKKDPVPYITAEPLPSNILEWHYVVCGPEITPYEGGYYHGKLVFPREFPFKPPSIYMITPSGRFKTNTRLCLSISDFHPDTWNPAWSVSTILTGLLSFMIEKSPTLGSIETTDFDKRQLAYQSLEFNLRDKQFCDLFPEIVTKIQLRKSLKPKKKRGVNRGGILLYTFKKLLSITKAEITKRNAMQNMSENQTSLQTTSEPSNFQSCLTNLIVLVGFAAFAFTVKYVMKTTASDSE